MVEYPPEGEGGRGKGWGRSGRRWGQRSGSGIRWRVAPCAWNNEPMEETLAVDREWVERWSIPPAVSSRGKPIDFLKIRSRKIMGKGASPGSAHSFPRGYALPRSPNKITHCFPCSLVPTDVSIFDFESFPSPLRSPRSALYVMPGKRDRTVILGTAKQTRALGWSDGWESVSRSASSIVGLSSSRSN